MVRGAVFAVPLYSNLVLSCETCRGVTLESCASLKTGTEYSNGIEITDGLSEGDIIVYDADNVNDEKRTVARWDNVQ